MGLRLECSSSLFLFFVAIRLSIQGASVVRKTIWLWSDREVITRKAIKYKKEVEENYGFQLHNILSDPTVSDLLAVKYIIQFYVGLCPKRLAASDRRVHILIWPKYERWILLVTYVQFLSLYLQSPLKPRISDEQSSLYQSIFLGRTCTLLVFWC